MRKAYYISFFKERKEKKMYDLTWLGTSDCDPKFIITRLAVLKLEEDTQHKFPPVQMCSHSESPIDASPH